MQSNHSFSSCRGLSGQSIRQFLKTPATIAVAMAMMPGVVFADCGDITTTPLNSPVSCAPASGDASLNIHNIDMTVSSNSTTAVSAISNDGNARIDSAGTIETAGDGASNGLWAQVLNGTGSVTIVNTGAITTNGSWPNDSLSGPSAIQGNVKNGNINITNSGALTTYGDGAHGINAISGGNGTVTVTNSGNIMTQGVSSGISVGHSGSGVNSGDIIINNSGNIYTYGTGNAISASMLDGGSSNVTINLNGGDIEAYDYLDGGAVNVQISGSGTGTINMNGGSITSFSPYSLSHGLSVNSWESGAAVIHMNAGSITTEGDSGIYAGNNLTGTGNIIITTGAGTTIDVSSPMASGGIYAHGASAAAGSTIDVDSQSSITSARTGIVVQSPDGGAVSIKQHGGSISSHSTGIWVETSGNVDVMNRDAITTDGNNAYGIGVTNASNRVNIDNSGAITTSGNASRGIDIYASTNGDISVTSSGAITTSGGANAGGVLINTTNARISTDISGRITTAGAISPAIELISLRSTEGTASNLLYFHDGVATVGAGSNGISLWTGGSNPTGSGEVRVGANTVVDASRGLTAVQNFMPEDSLINIAGGTQIIGGSGAGVQAGGQRIVVNNSGDISALSDLAIQNTAFPVTAQQMAISNQGMVTGNIRLGNGGNTFSNAGQWNLRQFADSDGDLTRDTLGVAINDFGSSGNNHISNSGVIALLGDNGQASTLNNSGEYRTGYAANNMTIGGAVQAQILGVQTFTHSGVIDMGPANGAVGDVLIISGGHTPGISGGGVFVADGGQISVDTVLNEGGVNSASDMLIVDSTRLGSAATGIKVINVGGHGAQTVDDGIEIVRVLDDSQSAAGVFKLSNRVVAGAYEYDLYQGGGGANAGNGNWYLRSLAAPRAETGVYLRNLSAASSMFMHTLHDRLGEPQFADAYKTDGNSPSVWVRVVANRTDSSAANSQIDLSTDTTLVHLGGDIARWSSNGSDRWHLGVMGAYGQSDTDADAGTTPSGYKRTANGQVDGYSIGAYATWYGNQSKPTGPYIDIWGQYAWYDNSVKGNGLKEESYDSTGWTVSVEGGYAFALGGSNTRQWMIEPQAQLAYNSYSADDHREANGTWVRNGDSDGVIARLGARLYSRSKLNDNGIQPFVEANWWYNSAKYDLAFNGQSISDDTPDSTYELKAGLQGEVAKGWQLWGHIGGRWGENSYSRYEGMVGVKHMF